MSVKAYNSLDRFDYEYNCEKYYNIILNIFKKFFRNLLSSL